jgi:predicted RNA-binding protein associated with RNAse of E/G family
MDFTKGRTVGRVHDITNTPSKKPIFHFNESEIGENTFLIKVSFSNSSYLIKGTFRKEYILNFYERNSQEETFLYDDVYFDVFSYCNGSYTQILQDKIPRAILEEIRRNDYMIFSNLPNKKTFF